jgi:hypothetical protein
MPAITNLVPKTIFNSFSNLEPILALLIVHQKITKSQYAAVISLCSGAYPLSLEIAQRTPKELIYVGVNNQNYTVNNRAKIKLS